MRITAAQPLMPGPHGGHLEPMPLLSLSEAEAEAAALQSDPATFTLEPLGEVPLDFLGKAMDACCSQSSATLIRTASP